jgi:hypothetical protein
MGCGWGTGAATWAEGGMDAEGPWLVIKGATVFCRWSIFCRNNGHQVKTRGPPPLWDLFTAALGQRTELEHHGLVHTASLRARFDALLWVNVGLLT